MKQPSKFFWTSILLYIASFFLLATGSSPPGDGRMPGFLCAFFAFVVPLDEARLALLHKVPVALTAAQFLSLSVSGWINPVFVVTIFLILSEQRQRTVTVLKAVLLVMMLFTALFFLTFRLFYPREGYFLWLVAIFLALFAESFSGPVIGDADEA
jgi:hypothetical protein